MEIVQGMENLRPRIGAVASSSAAVNEEIHVLAVSSLAHVRDHGDWTPVALLLNALPNGQRVKALAFWFRHFSAEKLIMRKADEGWLGTLAKTRAKEDFDVDAAMLTTFGDLTVERDPSIATVASIVKKLKSGAKREQFKDGKRVATSASIVLSAALDKAAAELLASPEYAEIKAKEKAEIEATLAA